MKRLDKILIANRGEIAVRVARTCRSMGIATVAVFSDADERALHVDCADEAVRIGPAPAAQSYLSIAAVIAAARRTGADAIHPGYGFLAENGDFAQACDDAGITFIGPDAAVIRALGSKLQAKRIAAQAGVPVIPGDLAGDDGGGDGGLDPAAILARAQEIAFPVLIKASAGGGGKGMRVVREAGELATALDSARREAKSAFGDDTLLIEKYIDHPRHIEFQILGDAHGNVVHLYERECSIQRRHQKIIEETPSPALDDDLRRRMGEAAVAVGKAAGYRNAGTVEFILAPDGRFYFLEVNTRLQVEHPITECITGIDLVREQIRVARGERLALEPPARSGVAIECRIYAEDPSNDFLPATGRIADWHLPGPIARSPGVRVEQGVRAGQEIGVHYDPMLAKLVCHAPDREQAIQKMLYLLRHLSVQGVTTNSEFLAQVIDHERFRAGDTDTHFVARHRAELAAASPGDHAVGQAAIAAAAAGHEARRLARTLLPRLEPGFRNNRFGDERIDYAGPGGRVIACSYRNLGAGRLRLRVAPGGGDSAPGGEYSADVRVVSWRQPELVIEDGDGVRRRFRVIAWGDRVHVHTAGRSLALRELPRFPQCAPRAVSGGLVAQMPGNVIAVLVAPGQAVVAGETVAIVEAMKMEHRITAPREGVVAEVAVSEGDQVEADALIAVVRDGA